MSTVPPSLRIVILYSSGHVGSAVILNLLAESRDCEIVGIVRAPPFKPGKGAVKKHFQKLGWRFSWMLVWQRVVQAVVLWLSIPLSRITGRKTYMPGWYVARGLGVPVWHTGNVNDAETRAFIAERKPDLLVSAYFSRILKAEVIRIPRLGVLNIHPGGLPAYKGAMSYFWVLKNNEARAGVTLHWINEGIDTGDIIRRRGFTVRPDTTQHQVLVTSAVIGGYMARAAVRCLRRGETLAAMPQPPSGGDDYYPMPTQADFDAYFRLRRFFRLRDVFAATLRRVRNSLSS